MQVNPPWEVSPFIVLKECAWCLDILFLVCKREREIAVIGLARECINRQCVIEVC